MEVVSMQTTSEKGAVMRNNTCRHIGEIIKRDGRKEKFDVSKINKAIKRCFTDPEVGEDENIADALADQITRAVVNILRQRNVPSTSIEDIQRIVIQQLWAGNHFEAAEHYSRYREAKRKEREFYRIKPEDQIAIDQDSKHFPTDIQYFQFISKYARWNEQKGRRETWAECVARVMAFFKRQPQLSVITSQEWQDMEEALFRLEATPAMRIVQMAGPALDRCNVGAYNCAYRAVDSINAFHEILYILMQGSGVGFSVETEYTDKLPRIKKQRNGKIHHHVIQDSTEGWCDALKMGIAHWYNGEDIEYDASLVRPQGARLKTKGGRASGPEPLMQLLRFVRSRILAKQGERLTDKDCHDIICMIGKIVQVGGVRRASEISLSDLDSLEMRHAKSGNWWETSPWLDMANNSAVYNEKPNAIEFMEEWLALAKSGSGERGIFNRGGIVFQIPKRRKKARFGINPCGEIILRSCQFCNLSIAVARPDDTVESLERKVRIATLFGTVQSTLTKFNYISEEWRRNCEEERLLGVDITGQMDCPLLRPNAQGREELLKKLKDIVLSVNQELSARLGINPSAATTCIKPSGNSSQFFNSSSGCHPRYSDYYIRRVRGSIFDPVSKLLKDEGVPCHVDPTNQSLLVFEFPVKSPAGSITRNEMTAIEMLDNWLTWKKNWAEHSVSCTIYVEPNEWLEVGHWVYKHWDDISGITFLPKDGGTYQLAPYEEIDQATYQKLSANFPKLNWAKLRRYETDDYTTSSQEYACVGGACEL
jgi:ribonucleoside-triphosphate reductase